MGTEVYIDAENLFGGFGAGFRHVDIGACVADSLRRHGLDPTQVSVVKVFGPWGYAGRQRGLDAVIDSIPGWMKQVRTGMAGSKSFADTHIVVDVLERHLTRDPRPDVYLFLGGDSDMIPFVRRLRKDTKVVLGAALSRGVKLETVNAYYRFKFLNLEGPYPRLYEELPKGDVQEELRGRVDQVMGEYGMLPASYVKSELERLARQGVLSPEASERCTKIDRVATFIRTLFPDRVIWPNTDDGTIERGAPEPSLAVPNFRGVRIESEMVDGPEFDAGYVYEWDSDRMLIGVLPLLGRPPARSG